MTDVAENTACWERFFLINDLSSNYITILYEDFGARITSLYVCVQIV